MPSHEVSKNEAPASVKEEEKKSSPSPVSPEQKAVTGEDSAIEPSTTKHAIFENSNPLPDASLNGDPSPDKRVSVDVSSHNAVDPSSDASQTRRLSEGSSTREKSIDTNRTKHSSTTDGEGYAGDATWEDRTWKEIIRLKEEMFWARAGGVR